MKKVKAHKLPASTQIAIGKLKEKSPKLTFVAIAAQFNVTYDQARDAVRRYQAGELVDRRGKRIRGKVSGDIEGTFRQLCDRAVSALYADNEITAIELVSLLEKMGGILKANQQMSLQGHLKRTDAGLIAALIRRYAPDATDEDVIKVYHEVKSAWIASL